MTATERAPLTGADIDGWVAGPLGAAAADRTAIPVAVGVGAGGVDAAVLAAALDGTPRPQGIAERQPGAGFIPWAPPDGAPSVPADPRLLQRLQEDVDPDYAARTMPSPLRLEIVGSVLPTEVVPRLLACAGVGSAILPVRRPPGALRRRAWSWPLRIGVADEGLLADLSAIRDGGTVPPALVDVVDVRTTPGGVDLLVLRMSPAEAAAFVTDRRQLANAVVCVADSTDPWPIDDARFSLVRAASSAVLTALVGGVVDVAASTLLTVRYLSHAQPLDIALTSAFGRNVIIAAEPDAVEAIDLPDIIVQRARRARGDIQVLARARPAATRGIPAAPPEEEAMAAPPFDPDSLSLTSDEYESLAGGAFDHESREASRAVELQAHLDGELEAAAAAVAETAPRLLQAKLGEADAPGAPTAQILQPGANTVRVFIGPEELGALHGLVVSDERLGFDDPEVDSARLTVVLAPLIPAGDPARTELDVPRFGRSKDAKLQWTLPESGLVQARLMIIHRNRVLQTGKLTGRVGEAARLTERIVLWDDVGGLDGRQPFDRTIVLNHDANGNRRAVTHADGATVIRELSELGKVTDQVREKLIAATQLSATAKLSSKAVRSVLIETATKGHALYMGLKDYLEGLVGEERIQIVTARSEWFLPLELVYHRLAPDEDAALCPNWEAGRECGDHCFADDDDTSIVCPWVFWGMRGVVERQQAKLTDPNGTDFVVSKTPKRTLAALSISSALVGASQKVVRVTPLQKAAAPLAGARTAADWSAWASEVKATPTDALVLMPHTNPDDTTLEISGKTLDIARLSANKYVTGGHDVTPIVVLFGCDTGGSAEDPAGYSARFVQEGAAAVVSTLTMLAPRHATEMVAELAAQLQAPGRTPLPVGEVLRAFRRACVRKGLLSALAVTSYGDAGWKV